MKMRGSMICLAGACASAVLALVPALAPGAGGRGASGKAAAVEVQETMNEMNLETIFLWDGAAPSAKGTEREDRPRIYVIRPEEAKANGAGIVVCPGGGYNGRAMDYEGLQVARRFTRAGLTAFVLCYRIGEHGYGPEVALLDAQRAMRVIRHRASELGVDPNRIAMVGFSAGGHLIINLSLHADNGNASSEDLVERVRCNPDAALLIYPYVPGIDEVEKGERPNVEVPDSPPPTFIAHTEKDHLLKPRGPLLYYQALVDKGVEAELHVFGGWGPHGIGMVPGLPGTQEWPALAMTWLRRLGLLTRSKRVAVEGTVSIKGEPVNSGWITLTPTESESDPIGFGWVGGWLGTPGVFSIAAEDGPVPGPHRVEIRHVVRKPGNEPSMPDEAVYPDVKIVTIKPGKNKIDIKIP